MTTAKLPTDDLTTTTDDVPAAAEPACDACEHPLADHDALGLRFCAATVAAALSRGCICR